MNYKILTFKQGSQEWFDIKKSSISGTLSYDLLKNGKEHALQQAYLHATNSLKYSGPVSKAAERGLLLEPDARNLLIQKLHQENLIDKSQSVDEVGYVLSTDYDCVGCSPDGVIFNKNKIKQICEIKCFGFKHHESCHERIDDGIMSQIQWNMWVTQSELCYFVQYNPDYLDESLTLDGKVHKDKVLYITRIYPKKEYQSSFINALR